MVQRDCLHCLHNDVSILPVFCVERPARMVQGPQVSATLCHSSRCQHTHRSSSAPGTTTWLTTAHWKRSYPPCRTSLAISAYTDWGNIRIYQAACVATARQTKRGL